MNKRTVYKRALVLVMALTMVAAAFYGITQRTGTARAASDPIGICVQGTTQCVQDSGNLTTDGNPIYLETEPTRVTQDFLWNLAQIGTVTYSSNCVCGKPFTDGHIDLRYSARPVYKIEKVTSSGHDGCIGLTSTYAYFLELESCDDANTDWVLSADQYLVSVGLTNTGPKTVPWLMTAIYNPGGGGPAYCDTSNGNQVVMEVLGDLCSLAWNTQG